MSEKLLRGLALPLFCLALAGAFWRAPRPASPAFVTPPAAQASTLPPLLNGDMLPKVARASFQVSLAELPDGRIAAAWLAGDPDKPAEFAIWLSRLDKSGWSAPQVIANQGSTAGGTFAHVRGIGDPLIYAEGSWLHLWYSSYTLGGEAGSSLNITTSTDGGANWSKPRKLQTSPLSNLSTRTYGAPLPLADGGLALPLSHDFIARHGEWLRLSADGHVLEKSRMPQATASLQPAAVVLGERSALAVLRDASPKAGKVRMVTTEDGGASWSAGVALPIDNPNSPVALLRLKSGRLLLAGNPPPGREALHFWISTDQGQTWQASRSVEAAADGAADFSNPALLLGRDGRIHLAYTWRGQGIKHVAFSEAWLDGGQP